MIVVILGKMSLCNLSHCINKDDLAVTEKASFEETPKCFLKQLFTETDRRELYPG